MPASRAGEVAVPWIRTANGRLINSDKLACIEVIPDPDSPGRWIVAGFWEPAGAWSAIHFDDTKDGARRVLDGLTRQLEAIWA